jgi:protein-S-isoprenylcysteine O-methyltransferase Ste14
MIFGFLLIICWLVFVFFWLFSSFSAKKTARGGMQHAWFRIIIIAIAVWFIFQFPTINGLIPPALWVQVLGVVLCALGIALAIWARVNLGTNWGMPMSLKVDPELVTSGPYRFIRHPIYTGVITSALGSALVTPAWFIAFVLFLIYFSYSAKKEEQIMIGVFGERYKEYMKHSKMLIPFIW